MWIQQSVCKLPTLRDLHFLSLQIIKFTKFGDTWFSLDKMGMENSNQFADKCMQVKCAEILCSEA